MLCRLAGDSDYESDWGWRAGTDAQDGLAAKRFTLPTKMYPPAIDPPAILPLLYPCPEKTGCAWNFIQQHDYISVTEAGILIL